MSRAQRQAHAARSAGDDRRSGRPRSGQVAEHDLLERRRPAAGAVATDEAEPLTGRAREDADDGARDGPARPARTDRPRPRECSAIAPAIDRSSSIRAAAEHQQPVAGLLDVGDDVRRQERGRAVGADRVDQDVQELATRQRVEAGQRLVEEEDRRPHPQRERQPDLRLLSPGQLVGARGERDVEVVEPAAGDGRIEARTEGRRHRHVLVDGQLAVERRRLRDVADPLDRAAAVAPRVDAVDGQVALGRSLEADPRLEQGGLAGAVRPDERGDAAVRDREVDVAERPAPPAVALADVVRLEDRHRRLPMTGAVERPDRADRRWRAVDVGDAVHVPGRRSGIPRTRTGADPLLLSGRWMRRCAIGSPSGIAAVSLSSSALGDPDVRPVRPGSPPGGRRRPGRSSPRSTSAASPARAGLAPGMIVTAAQRRDADPAPAVRLPGPSVEPTPGPGDRRGADSRSRSASSRPCRPTCAIPRRPAGRRSWPRRSSTSRRSSRGTSTTGSAANGWNQASIFDDGRSGVRETMPSVFLGAAHPVHRRLVAGQRPGGRRPPAARGSAGGRDRRAVHPAAARGDLVAAADRARRDPAGAGDGPAGDRAHRPDRRRAGATARRPGRSRRLRGRRDRRRHRPGLHASRGRARASPAGRSSGRSR